MWADIGVVLLLLFGFYAFIEVTGFRTRMMTRHTDRSAADMYDNYADSDRAQRRYARRHGGKPGRPKP